MDISEHLAKQIICKHGLRHTRKVNQIGGEIKCIDLENHWFILHWFHGDQPCYGDIRSAWIGKSETNKVII